MIDLSTLKQLVELGSTVIVVLLFLLYLERKDKRSKETYDSFNTTINNHLEHSTKVIKENSKVIGQSLISYQKLCDTIKNLNGRKKKK